MRFPDTDPKFKGISSLDLLADVAAEIAARGFKISNMDATLFAERPRIGPFREQMAQNLATITGIERHRVNIKATTTEGLGFIGRREGLAAAAVVLLEETSNI